MQNEFITQEGVPAFTVKNDMNRAGYTDIAITLAMKSLVAKDMCFCQSKTAPLVHRKPAHLGPRGWQRDHRKRVHLIIENGPT
jgi:hypothetical protein